ncbi:MAG: hypothetical protein ABI746_00295 [Dermatophilaceae bacterium]
MDQTIRDAVQQAAAKGPKELAGLLYEFTQSAFDARTSAAPHSPNPGLRGMELTRLSKIREATLSHKMAYEPRG